MASDTYRVRYSKAIGGGDGSLGYLISQPSTGWVWLKDNSKITIKKGTINEDVMSKIVEGGDVNCAGYKISIISQIVHGTKADMDTNGSQVNEVKSGGKGALLSTASNSIQSHPNGANRDNPTSYHQLNNSSIKVESTSSKNLSTFCQIPSLDPLLENVMRPHQKEATNFILTRLMGHGPAGPLVTGAILADDMGTGKTLVGISVLWSLVRHGRSKGIVVCPSSLIGNWEREIMHWLGSTLGRTMIAVSSSGSQGSKKAEAMVMQFISSHPSVHPVLVIGYEMFRNYATLLNEADSLEVLVCDEGHRLKNAYGTSTSVALGNCCAMRRVVLTGTPLQNNLDELYSVVQFVAPGFLGSLQEFKKLYADPIVTGKTADASGKQRVQGEAAVVSLRTKLANIVLRRTRDAVLKRILPPRRDFIVHCGMSPSQIEDYFETAKDALAVASKDTKSTTKTEAATVKSKAAAGRTRKRKRKAAAAVASDDENDDEGDDKEEEILQPGTRSKRNVVAVNNEKEVDGDDDEGEEDKEDDENYRGGPANTIDKDDGLDGEEDDGDNEDDDDDDDDGDSSDYADEGGEEDEEEDGWLEETRKRKKNHSKKQKKSSAASASTLTTEKKHCKSSPLSSSAAATVTGTKKAAKGKGSNSSGVKMSGVLPQIMQLRQHCNMVYPADHEYNVLGTKDATGAPAQLPDRPQSLNEEVDRMLSASVKFRVLDKIISGIKQLQPKEKVVVVSNFTTSLDDVELLARMRKWHLLRLDGSVQADRRMKLVQHFNSEASPFFLMLLSAKAGGVGLNLIGGSRLVLLEPDWNPATDQQAMARIWRDGQTKPVFIYRLISQGTIEESIIDRQSVKNTLSVVIQENPQDNEEDGHVSRETSSSSAGCLGADTGSAVAVAGGSLRSNGTRSTGADSNSLLIPVQQNENDNNHTIKTAATTTAATDATATTALSSMPVKENLLSSLSSAVIEDLVFPRGRDFFTTTTTNSTSAMTMNNSIPGIRGSTGTNSIPIAPLTSADHEFMNSEQLRALSAIDPVLKILLDTIATATAQTVAGNSSSSSSCSQEVKAVIQCF